MMASGFIARDGRDLDSIFTRATGGGGNDAGFKSPDGLDLRWRYMPGNSGVSTGFVDPAGVDLGARFGFAENAHLATFGADIDNAIFWVFYFNNPGASGVYDAWGYWNQNIELWLNHELFGQLRDHLSSYSQLSFSWARDPNDHNRGTMEIIQVPNPSNWNEIRVKQSDPPNGAGWGRYRLFVTARG